jgi:transposase InsO family protein
MDQYSRRIIGFGVQALAVDGEALCRMFNQAIFGQALPVRLSFDHDPLFQFRRWQANLRILGIEPVRSVPRIAWSHPFVERLVGTLRREFLDQLFYWNGQDLERKLDSFRVYFNAARVHQALGGDTPKERIEGPAGVIVNLAHFRWETHCHGLVQLPAAA